MIDEHSPHSLLFGVLGTCLLKTTIVICFTKSISYVSTTGLLSRQACGHLPAHNNNGHMFYQKLFLCINDGPVIVTGISLLYQQRAFYRDRHSFSWDEIKSITLKLRLTFVVKDSTLNIISYHCG